MTAAPVVEGRPGPALDLFLVAGSFSTPEESLRFSVRYAQAAEAVGFDAVWIAEHHFISYGVCPSAMAMAAHILGATSRIKVGTAAAILSNRHPVALAEEAAMLDALSGGRFLLGVARGGPWVDLEVFGTGLSRYQSGFPEGLDLLRRCLSGASTVDASGPHFSFRPVSVVPRPDRPMPVWVAATSSATVDLAASSGMPLLLGMHSSAEEHRELIDRHSRHLGYVAENVTAHLAYVADSAVEARGALATSLPSWLATTAGYVRIDGSSGPGRDPQAYAERLVEMHAVGTPDHCVERLAKAAATSGARRMMLMVEAAGDPALTLTNISRLGSQVLPQLRSPLGVS